MREIRGILSCSMIIDVMLCRSTYLYTYDLYSYLQVHCNFVGMCKKSSVSWYLLSYCRGEDWLGNEIYISKSLEFAGIEISDVQAGRSARLPEIAPSNFSKRKQ